jgi:Mor family transcriptional regulator
MGNALLPSCLTDIEASIGLEKTLKLVKRYGGQVIFISKNVTQDCDLVKVLGFDAAVKISHLLGGNQVLIPTCKKMKCSSRNDAIRLDRAKLTLSELATKYQLSYSQIQKICRTVAQ